MSGPAGRCVDQGAVLRAARQREISAGRQIVRHVTGDDALLNLEILADRAADYPEVLAWVAEVSALVESYRSARAVREVWEGAES